MHFFLTMLIHMKDHIQMPGLAVPRLQGIHRSLRKNYFLADAKGVFLLD
jgi:hypothetical protein